MEQELPWRLLLTNPAVYGLTGAIIVSNLKEANHQKQISLSPSDEGEHAGRGLPGSRRQGRPGWSRYFLLRSCDRGLVSPSRAQGGKAVKVSISIC